MVTFEEIKLKYNEVNNDNDLEHAVHSNHLYQHGLNMKDRIHNPLEVNQPSNNPKPFNEKKLGNQYSTIYPSTAMILLKNLLRIERIWKILSQPTLSAL